MRCAHLIAVSLSLVLSTPSAQADGEVVVDGPGYGGYDDGGYADGGYGEVDDAGLPATYEGAGIRVVIERMTDWGMSGSAELDGRPVRWDGEFVSEVEFRGAFVGGGERIEFFAREQSNGDVEIRTERRSYRLRMIESTTSRPAPSTGGVDAGIDVPGHGVEGAVAGARPHSGSGGRGASRHTVPTTVTLERASVTDGEVVSHTYYKPKGWDVDGRVRWVPEARHAFASLDLRVRAEDGREAAIYPVETYQYSGLFEMGLPGSPTRGQRTTDGNICLPFTSPANYVAEVLLPTHRRGISGVRVVSARRLDEMITDLRQKFEPTIRNVASYNAQSESMGDDGMQLIPFAEEIRVAYQDRGQSFEEDVTVMGWIVHSQLPTAAGMVNTQLWAVLPPMGARAPVGRLDGAKPILEAVTNSVRPNPKWQAAIMDIRTKRDRREIDGMIESHGIRREAADRAWETHQQTVRTRNESDDRVNRKLRNTIMEVEDYRLPNGSMVELPAYYDRAFFDGQEQVVLTNDPSLEPASLGGPTDWTPIARAQ